MPANPVVHCTFIIRSQIEYSLADQAMVVRCILEMPATGQRRGFSDLDALLTAVRAEVMGLQAQLLSPQQEKGDPL